MRINRILLIAAMIVSLSASAWSQIPGAPSPSTRPPSVGTRLKKLLNPPVPWPPARHVISMKLLAPGAGWALTAGRRVLWTIDNGAHWRNVTPPGKGRSDGLILNVFFLDLRHGWVLSARPGETELNFDVAYTNDGGATWSQMYVRLPKDLDTQVSYRAVQSASPIASMAG